MNLTKYNNGGYINTPKGEFYIRTAGVGTPLVIIHGGPGLDHSYLYKFLLPLAQNHLLVFYDQLGTGKDKTKVEQLSIKKLQDQLGEIAKFLGFKRYDCLTHSWGAFLMMLNLPNEKIDHLIMSNPIGLTYERFLQSDEAFSERITNKETIEKIYNEECLKENAAGFMNAILPYYLGNRNSNPDIVFENYSNKTYQKTVDLIVDYNLIEKRAYLPAKTLIIYGEKDFEPSSSSRELWPFCDQKTIKGVGHFPFAEKNEEFINIVDSYLNER